MKDMGETWLQSYARESVFAALSRIKHGRLVVNCGYLTDKKSQTAFGETQNEALHASIAFNSPRVWERICQQFDLGFAEAYMTQEIECDNLLGLFLIYIANQKSLGFAAGGWLYTIVPGISRLLFARSNNVALARQNASFHYDTSNDHFASFLSPDMNYSSALWSANPNETLEMAQKRKIANIIKKACITSSDHILDIGCGWGDLAIEAVKQTGCRVTGLTLSVEQKKLADERIAAAGLQHRIELLICDYRKAPRRQGGYDCVVSVEMLEHVGDKFMDKYFSSISHLLKEQGGRMVVQGITVLNSSNGKKANVGAFLDRHIFPGGYLPTINQLLMAIHTGSEGTLEVQNVQNIGINYIKTLQCWRNNFQDNWPSIRESFLVKSPTATEAEVEYFRRKWIYYFTYCEAGFRSRVLGDYVISAIKTPDQAIYNTAKYEGRD